MKRAAIILVVLLLMLTSCSPKYEKTSEHELLTIRGFTSDAGYDWVTISYRYQNGIKTEVVGHEQIGVGDENKVILYEGKEDPIVFLTVDDYNVFYRLNGLN